MIMRWAGLKTRVILTYLIIFMVSTGIVVWRAGSVFAQTAIDSAEHDLEVQAYVLATALERPLVVDDANGHSIVIPQLQSIAGTFAQGANSQLTILDPRGNALATSRPTVPVNQANQPEVVAALAGGIQHQIRFDALAGEQMIYAAAPVQHDGRTFGVVQISIPLSQVTTRTNSFWFGLGLTALLAAGVASLAGWWLAGELVRPVRRLRDAASRLAAGNLDERVPAEGVAEIAQLGTAFNHMAEQIEDMVNRQRVFVANASHELRTPLTNIKLRAEALGNGALDEPEVAGKFVSEIESEANRLTHMANELLTLSRQDVSPQRRFETVDTVALIGGALAEVELRAQKAGIRLVSEVPAGLPDLEADPGGLRTVLVNLLDNALQYTPSGGEICLQAWHNGEGLRVRVSDTGAGIPQEDLPHVFERFYRVDKARSRRARESNSGAGLGLAIVKGIVEEHGGKVSVDSTLGQGTTVTITLPVGERLIGTSQPLS